MAEDTHTLTVWYDGQSPLCVKEIALMRRLDKRDAINFVDASEDDASLPFDREIILARFHVTENAETLSGARAIATMWRAIPLLRPFGKAAQNGALEAILEDLYRAFLKVRPKIDNFMRGYGG